MHLCIHSCSLPYLKEMKEYSTRVHTCNLANIRVHSCIHASTCITRIHVMHVFAWMRVFNQPQHVQMESLYTTTRTVNKVLYISSMSFSSRKQHLCFYHIFSSTVGIINTDLMQGHVEWVLVRNEIAHCAFGTFRSAQCRLAQLYKIDTNLNRRKTRFSLFYYNIIN